MELKLRSAARLAVFVWLKVEQEMETTLRNAQSQPLGERSARRVVCQMSFCQKRASLERKP
jgi:hypothetical protein